MMNHSRRDLLLWAAVAGAGARAMRGAVPGLRIGVTDWNLKLGAKPEAVSLAAQLGFDGVQVSFGRRLVDDKLPLDNPELIDQYLFLSGKFDIPLDGTCVDKLHD